MIREKAQQRRCGSKIETKSALLCKHFEKTSLKREELGRSEKEEKKSG